MMKNPYEPISVKIEKIEKQSKSVLLFRLKREDGKDFAKDKNEMVFIPGQFVLAGIWGYGESPFGPASNPYNAKHIDIVVRKTGQLTSALHNSKEGDEITLRGPYGNGYPLRFFTKKDILLVTGGCGIPPIASLIEYMIADRSNFGNIHLIYGSSTPSEILLKDRLKEWKKNINVILTVDKPEKGWDGKVGRTNEHLADLKINPANTAVAMCGPGPMVDAIEYLLNDIGISDRKIFVSMERNMQCGVGKCQHCVCGNKYVCIDGPVFYLDEVDKAWDNL